MPTLAAPMALLPASIVEAAADPLPGLLAHRAQLEREWLAIPGSEEGTLTEKAAWEAFRRAEEAIETTVATTPQGVAAQIAYMKASYGGPLKDPDLEGPVLVDGVPYAFLDVILEGLRGIAL